MTVCDNCNTECEGESSDIKGLGHYATLNSDTSQAYTSCVDGSKELAMLYESHSTAILSCNTVLCFTYENTIS